MREIDQRFNILGGVESLIDDPGSPGHTDHSLLQLLRRQSIKLRQAMKIAMTPIT
jgi:hypothetical protein